MGLCDELFVVGRRRRGPAITFCGGDGANIQEHLFIIYTGRRYHDKLANPALVLVWESNIADLVPLRGMTQEEQVLTDRDLYIAAYDIASVRRLRAALGCLKGYAIGGQKSVFECFLTASERRTLLEKMGAIVNPEEDRFLLIRLDPRSRVRVLGIGVEPQDPPFFYHS